MRGRVGDSPQVGSGLYVEAGVGGATSTGLGEEVTRIAGTARVVASMRAGLSPQAACEEVGLDRLFFILAAQSPFKPGSVPGWPGREADCSTNTPG